jgi:hypothetical protein
VCLLPLSKFAVLLILRLALVPLQINFAESSLECRRMLIMRWFGESDFTPEQCSRRCDVCRNNAACGTLRPEGGWLGGRGVVASALGWLGAAGAWVVRHVVGRVDGWTVIGWVGSWVCKLVGSDDDYVSITW